MLRQEIDVVGLSVPVAFALDHPIGFELPAAKIGTLTELRLAPRWSGEVALRISPLDIGADGDDVHAYAGTHYIAYSRDAMSMVRAGAGKPLHDVDPAAVAPFLALPPSLSPRVIELAKKITAGRTNAPAKLLAILDWLRTTHDYTTNLQRNPAIADPLEDFLFEQKAGHCEYFASATAVLLRAAGVPSRYVNGFLGGEWNEIGHYVAVRENRAHSWAEAYMGELGWMRVDATPPNRGLFRMGRLRQIFDSIDFFWGRWVVGYDLGRQIELARRLGHQLGGASDDGDPHPAKVPWKKIVAALAGAAALWSLLRRLVFRRGLAPGLEGRTSRAPCRNHAGGAPVRKSAAAAGAARAGAPAVGDAARVRDARRRQRRGRQRRARSPHRPLHRRALRPPLRRRWAAARAGGAPAGDRASGAARPRAGCLTAWAKAAPPPSPFGPRFLITRDAGPMMSASLSSFGTSCQNGTPPLRPSPAGHIPARIPHLRRFLPRHQLCSQLTTA